MATFNPSSVAPDTVTNPIPETPENFETPEDSRKKGGKYPLYYSHKSRSGHVFNMDDTPDAESVTLQHRSGSSIQMNPDGMVTFTNKKGKYEVTFGEQRMVVTGAYDTVVQGGASMRVEGDYNMTVQGNVNWGVKGNWNVVCDGGGFQTFNKDFDTAVLGNQTTKVKGNSEHASEGRTVLTGDGGVAIGSSADAVGIQAATDLAILASGGKAMVQASGDVSLKSGGTVGIDGGPDVYINSGASVPAAFSYTKTVV